jgi:hypothetical protein
MPEPLNPPFFPIIYIRGYAGTQSDVEDTAADPYMGFNIGSSKLRQLWNGTCQRFFFESPLVRLMKDYGYRDVYEGGDAMPQNLPIAPKSIIVHRYYERTSTELGDGKRLSISDAAAELGKLILMVRDRLCGSEKTLRHEFRVYLVAHSMGGLVCRCLLQNDGLKDPVDPKTPLQEARAAVDKVFTYATPHNGIDLNLIGNVPGFWTINDADNFDRDKMRQYLGLPSATTTGTDRVDTLNGKVNPNRLFCLVGTNDNDYDVGGGLVRKAVGPMSDGLVRITT